MSEPVGIIYPPPDLRSIVDSTAKYVAKNGGAFEERIMREHKDKPKFSFLFPEDPFNAYYRHKVREIRNSLIGDIDSRPPDRDSQNSNQRSQQGDATTTERHDLLNGDTSSKSPTIQANENDHHRTELNDHEVSQQQQQQDYHDNNNELHEQRGEAPKVRPKLNEYIQEMTMKLEEPPPLNHLATSAPSLTRMDCDIIRLTSQFIATYGRSFLLELVSREQNNSQFDFLKPQHGQFSYMTNLIMQYALIQNPPLDIIEQLEKDVTSQKHVLHRIKMRAEWNRMLEMEKKKKEEAEEKEKILYSQIDWHDFVVVETIDYRPDEMGEYPPTTADQVGTRLLIQQRCEDQNVPEEMEIDMDTDSDQEESGKEDDFAIPNPPDASRVIIRKDYNPKAANKVFSQPDNYFVSPITNERIPVDKIHEHVRFNLADPRYLEKKDQMLQEKMNEEAVFASGSQIQDSLKNLAERRTDIFGMNDEETAIGRRIGEEEQAKPKDDRLIWDGHKSSLKKKKLN